MIFPRQVVLNSWVHHIESDFMKKITAIFACLALTSGAVAAQNTSHSGMINRDASAMEQQTIASTPVIDISDKDIEMVRDEHRNRQIMVSYDPADLDDTTGMDAYEVITWTDRRGVRHYTDDKKKAPKYSHTRNIYSLPPSTNIEDPEAPLSYELIREKEEEND